MLERKVSKDNLEKMKEYCKENNVTFVFESVDMENDPHIIKYPESRLYLLSVVNNDIKFSRVPYDELVDIATKFGLQVKEKAFVLKDWQEFFDWYNEITQSDYLYKGNHIEGFVVEDSKGFMVKFKLQYYKFWKHMRSIAHRTLRIGYITGTGQLYNALSNEFYGFCRELFNSVETKEEREDFPRDAVTLRDMFYEKHPNASKDVGH